MWVTALLLFVLAIQNGTNAMDGVEKCILAEGRCLASERSCRPTMQLKHVPCPDGRNCCKTTKKLSLLRVSKLRGKKDRKKCKKTSKDCRKARGKCQDKKKKCKSGVQKDDLCSGELCTCCLKGCKQKKKCKSTGGICQMDDQCCLENQLSFPLCKKGCHCCVDASICVIAPSQNITCSYANSKLNASKSLPILTKIIDGEQVVPAYKYPWMVVIDADGILCGGSIISNQYVITAAHCLRIYLDIDSSCNFKPHKVVVTIADHNIDIEDDDKPGVTKTISASKLITHPEYDYTTQNNDIALIILSKRLDLMKDIEVGSICLPVDDTNTFSGYNATVLGWGMTNTDPQNPEYPETLMEVSLPILENCDSYPENDEITENMLCAGNITGNKDSCDGDSGGPLFVEESNGQYTLVGIVSFGPEIEDRVCPGIGVYTRVSKYIDWIRDTMKSYNCK